MNAYGRRPEPHQPEAWLRRAESDLALARHAAAAEDVLPEDARGRGSDEDKNASRVGRVPDGV